MKKLVLFKTPIKGKYGYKYGFLLDDNDNKKHFDVEKMYIDNYLYNEWCGTKGMDFLQNKGHYCDGGTGDDCYEFVSNGVHYNNGTFYPKEFVDWFDHSEYKICKIPFTLFNSDDLFDKDGFLVDKVYYDFCRKNIKPEDWNLCYDFIESIVYYE